MTTLKTLGSRRPPTRRTTTERVAGQRQDLDPSWYVKLEHAIETASRSADQTGLPQTVYRNQDTCGWTNTNAFAGVLNRSTVFATMMPASYWS